MAGFQLVIKSAEYSVLKMSSCFSSTNIHTINMQHSRKVRGLTTAQHRRPCSPDDTPDGSYSDNLSYTTLNNNDSFQCPEQRETLNVRRYGHGQDDEGFTSTEQSFSTCASGNHSRTLDNLLGPHTGYKPSTSLLTGDEGDLSVLSRQRNIHSFRHWRWEILSTVTLLCLLGALIGTLAKHDHGTQPEWPYNISTNSLISVFAAVMIAQLSFLMAESTYQAPLTLVPV